MSNDQNNDGYASTMAMDPNDMALAEELAKVNSASESGATIPLSAEAAEAMLASLEGDAAASQGFEDTPDTPAPAAGGGADLGTASTMIVDGEKAQELKAAAMAALAAQKGPQATVIESRENIDEVLAMAKTAIDKEIEVPDVARQKRRPSRPIAKTVAEQAVVPRELMEQAKQVSTTAPQQSVAKPKNTGLMVVVAILALVVIGAIVGVIMLAIQ